VLYFDLRAASGEAGPLATPDATPPIQP
jgi:hypothetical protein